MHLRIASVSILAALLVAGRAHAQPAEPSLSPAVSGHFNGTYNFNVMDPMGDINPFHSYDAFHNTFLLNAAHLVFSGSDDRLAYAVELDGGTDAAINTGVAATGGTYAFDVQEAWVSYTGQGGLGFKAGKFVTYQGIEVIESPFNPTVSRGFLFGLAEPFGHVGGVLTYKVSDTLDFAVGAINGWDVMVDNNDMKTLVGKLGVTTPSLLLTTSLYAGPEQAGNDEDWRFSIDVTGVSKMANFDLWFQANAGLEQNLAGGDDATWMGAGVQPVFRLGPQLTLGTRAEVFVDSDGARTGIPGGVTLINLSAAPAFPIYRTLVLRAEGRLDFANEDVFVDNDGNAGAMQIIAMLEALLTF